jgi:hypothetical protein
VSVSVRRGAPATNFELIRNGLEHRPSEPFLFSRTFAYPAADANFGEGQLVLALQEAVGDDAGLFHDALFLCANHQPDELRHAPRERGGTTGS